MGGFQQGFGYGQQLNQNAFHKSEEERISQREAMANLHQQVLASPDSTPDQRNQALTAITGLYAPHEAPSLMARLGGLIHGQVQQTTDAQKEAETATQAAQAAPVATAGAPNAQPAPIVKDALGIPISDPNVAAAHGEPMHPFQTETHPVLSRLREGLDAIGNHLKGFSQPVVAAPKPAIDLKEFAGLQSPEQVKRDTMKQAAEALDARAAAKNASQITQAEIRVGGIRGVPYNAGSLSLESALARNDQEGTTYIDQATGKPIDLELLHKSMPDAKLVPYYQGSRLLGYSIADQKGHTTNVGNIATPVGEFGNRLNQPVLGPIKTATTKSASSTDQYGNTTSSSSTSTPQTLAPSGPVSARAPRAGGVPTANATSLTAINQSIQANKGKATSVAPKSKGGPVSARAPQAPSQQLDADGQIPANVGNSQVREFAQDLINDRDVDKIPAKARAAAEQLARQYGWEQGKFTPREQTQMNVASGFLQKLKDSPSLDVLNNFVSRNKIAVAINDEKKGTMATAAQIATTMNLSPAEAEFVYRYNAAVGTIQGLAAITRTGRPTESAVTRLKAELPNVLHSANAADARNRLDQLFNEIKLATQKGSLRTGGGEKAAPTKGGENKSKGTVSLANARSLPQYKGKSDAEITSEAKKFGYTVTP